MPWAEDLNQVVVYVDADFAGCRATRRSTCGGCVMWGQAMLKAWSRTLSTLALSTGEAELGAIVKGATEGEGWPPSLETLALMSRSSSSLMPRPPSASHSGWGSAGCAI